MRTTFVFIISLILLMLLFAACLTTGAVKIPAVEVLKTLFTTTDENDIYHIIVFETRLPMAIAGLLCGMALSVAGLLLQTTFSNPLAGPSILGVSTGASLGVAFVMLGTQWLHITMAGSLTQFPTIIGAVIGAGVIIMILLLFSSMVKSTGMLLIAGIMIGYLASAVISWLNFYAPANEVKNFALWGMGSFTGITLKQIPTYSIILLILCGGALCMAKPLNALLAGDNYAQSLGYDPRKTRSIILLYAGLLTAVPTAFCGPVGFIGLAVPHIARIVYRSSHHTILLPATALTGGIIGLLCAWMCVSPGEKGILPLSAVTPVIGIPVILYVIIRRKRLYYFS